MSYLRTSGSPRLPQQQAVTVFDQAAPVQNTFYTVLNTTANARIIAMKAGVTVANETLEVRFTIDGIQISAAAACNFGTEYDLIWRGHMAGAGLELETGTNEERYRPFLLEGKSVKIEMRKTTAAGAGHLQATLIYAIIG